MNKAKIMLAGICLFAAIGGALASKSKNAIFTYYYKTGTGALSYTSTTVDFGCAGSINACTTKTDPDAPSGVPLYTFANNAYVAILKP